MPTNQFTQAVSGILARALGEAASGYVGLPEYEGAQLWFVVSYEPVFNAVEDQNDYFISQPYPSQTAAEDAAGTNPELVVFGPFSAVPVPGFGIQSENPITVGAVLISTIPPLPPPAPPGFSIEMTGSEFDAAFFSLPALQKFAMPYYASVYGPAFADTLLEAFSTAPVALMVHLPWSEYVLEMTLGTINPNTSTQLGTPPATLPAPQGNAPQGVAADVMRIYHADGSKHHIYPPPRR